MSLTIRASFDRYASFDVIDARYAKGQKLVRPVSDGSGIKTRADRLCCALKGRWTHREQGYIMSPAKVSKLRRLFATGWDASFFSSELIPPRELRGLDEVREYVAESVGRDDHDGVLSEAPGELACDARGAGEHSLTRAGTRLLEDLDHEAVFAPTAPDAAGAEECRVGEAPLDRPPDAVVEGLRIEGRREPLVAARGKLARKASTDVDPHAAGGSGISGSRSSVGSSHACRISEGTRELDDRARVGYGAVWIYIDVDPVTGGTLVETSWLPDTANAMRLAELGFRRQRSGHYRVLLAREDSDDLSIARRVMQATIALLKEGRF